MRQLTVYIFGLLFLSISCRQPKDSNHKNLAFIIPVIIDTFPVDRVVRENVWQESGRYNPLYIGKRKDSIVLSNGHIQGAASFKKYLVYEGETNRFPYPDSSGIELIIDTTKIVFEYSIFFRSPFVYPDTIAQRKFYKAHPVYVINTAKETLSIGYGDHLPLILEAVDKNGKWRAIQKQFMYMCDDGINTIILPPDNIVVTSVPIFKGQFKTKLRLRYKNILSDTFTGTINLSQFESGGFDANEDVDRF